MPLIDNCFKCKLKCDIIKDFRCYSCSACVHPICVGISRQEIPNKKIVYQCDDCYSSGTSVENVNTKCTTLKKLSDTMMKIEADNNMIKESIESLSANLNVYKKEVDDIKSDIQSFNERLSRSEKQTSVNKNDSSTSVKKIHSSNIEHISDMNDRQHRSKNIVVHGVSGTSVNQSKEYQDSSDTKELLKATVPNSPPMTVQCYRIGVCKSKVTRPLKVILCNEQDIISILQNVCKDTTVSPNTNDFCFTSERFKIEHEPLQQLDYEFENYKPGDPGFSEKFVRGAPKIISKEHSRNPRLSRLEQ